jgi:hypothetical protein
LLPDKLRSAWNCAVIAVACTGAIGCGAPDLQAMRPTVPKKAAEVLLVGHPAHWSIDQVRQLQPATGVVLAARTVSGKADVLAELRRVAQAATPPLVVVVTDAPPSTAVRAFLNRHQRVRVEWLARQAATVSLHNLRQVEPNPELTAYASGWVAGTLAMQGLVKPAGRVGWLVDGQAGVPLRWRQAALAGIYNSDTIAQLVPVSFSSANPSRLGAANAAGSAGGGSNSSGANTGLTNPSGGGAGHPTPVLSTRPPGVVLALGSAGPSARQQAAALHTVLLTPFAADSSQSLVTPALPTPSALIPDLKAYATGTWRSGTKQVATSPQVQLQPGWVPKALETDLLRLQMTLADHPDFPHQQWNGMSAARQQQWQAILNGSSA